MKVIITILSSLTIMLACVFIVLLIIDTFQVIADSDSHLFSIEENWFQKNPYNYIIGNILSIVVLGVFVFIGIMKKHMKFNKLINALYIIFTMFFLTIVLCGYFQWYFFGYDHY